MRIVMDEMVRSCIPRWDRVLLPALAAHYGGLPSERPDDLFVQQVRLICSHRLPGGATACATYAAEAPGLTEEERETLRRWQQASFGIMLCDVRRFESDRIYVYSPTEAATLCVLSPQ